MKINQLKAFVAVASTGTIHGASRLICVTQPAITKSIKNLEEKLDTVLIIRHNSGVTLTSEGQSLLLRAKRILAEMEAARSDISSQKGNSGTSVSIGVTPSASLILSEMIENMLKVNPHVTVNFIQTNATEIKKQLTERKIDFGIGMILPWIDYSGFAIEPLYQDRSAFIVKKEHPLKDNCSIEDILRYPLLSISSDKRNLLYVFEHIETLLNKKISIPETIPVCMPLPLIYTTLLNSEMVGFWLASSSAKNKIFNNQLRAIYCEQYQLPMSTIALIKSHNSLMTLSSLLFFESIKKLSMNRRCYGHAPQKNWTIQK